MGVGGLQEKGLEPIEERTYRFALRVIKLVDSLPPNAAAGVLGRQLLRAATSIGAKVEEAIGAPSKRDFTNKMTIALKEARETHYWLRLIRDAGILNEERLGPIVQEALEIKKILSVTVKTARKNPDRHP
jgi:four helix bundle protein